MAIEDSIVHVSTLPKPAAVLERMGGQDSIINAIREGLNPVPIIGIIIAKTARLGITLKQLKRFRITLDIILFL